MTDPLLLAAIAPYGISIATSATLHTLGSRIERIADTNGTEHALRNYALEQFNLAESNSEMIWLDYAARQGTVTVPQPIATQSGIFIADREIA